MFQQSDYSYGVDGRKLQEFVDRVEAKHNAQKAISVEISDIYREARVLGLDVKALKSIVRLRAEDPRERERHDATMHAYIRAMGYDPRDIDGANATDEGDFRPDYEPNQSE